MTGTTAVDLLTIAKNVIVERGWTKGALARTSDGIDVSPHNPKATCFCAVGAFDYAQMTCTYPQEYVNGKGAGMIASYALSHAAPNLMTLSFYNDLESTTKEDIIALFDRAIEKASA